METVYFKSEKVEKISNEITNILHLHLDEVFTQQCKFEDMIKNIPFVKNILNENKIIKKKCHELEIKLLEKSVETAVDDNLQEKLKFTVYDSPKSDLNNSLDELNIEKNNVKINHVNEIELSSSTDTSSESDVDEETNLSFSELVGNLKKKSVDDSVKNVMIDLNVNSTVDETNSVKNDVEDDPQIKQLNFLTNDESKINLEVKRLKESAKKRISKEIISNDTENIDNEGTKDNDSWYKEQYEAKTKKTDVVEEEEDEEEEEEEEVEEDEEEEEVEEDEEEEDEEEEEEEDEEEEEEEEEVEDEEEEEVEDEEEEDEVEDEEEEEEEVEEDEEDDEEEEEVEEEDDDEEYDEVEEVVINGVRYYSNGDSQNGGIYEILEEDECGELIGKLQSGILFLS